MLRRNDVAGSGMSNALLKPEEAVATPAAPVDDVREDGTTQAGTTGSLGMSSPTSTTNARQEGRDQPTAMPEGAPLKGAYPPRAMSSGGGGRERRQIPRWHDTRKVAEHVSYRFGNGNPSAIWDPDGLTEEGTYRGGQRQGVEGYRDGHLNFEGDFKDDKQRPVSQLPEMALSEANPRRRTMRYVQCWSGIW